MSGKPDLDISPPSITNTDTVDFPASTLQQSPQDDRWHECKVLSCSHESHSHTSHSHDSHMPAQGSSQYTGISRDPSRPMDGPEYGGGHRCIAMSHPTRQ